MKSGIHLTDENYILYAIKHYDNPSCCGIKEFYDDIKRIGYIKKLLSREDIDSKYRCKMILNHIITLSNVFGVDVVSSLLFFRIDIVNWPYIKSILVYLGIMPEHIWKDKMHYNDSDIPIDTDIANYLREI